jgi:hypothetical protein
MQNIKNIFSGIEGIESFRKIDENHILNLYLGIDNMSRETILLLSENRPKNLYSSQLISVQLGERRDGRWAVSFSLLNKKYMDLFCHFCHDIIESSRLLVSRQQDTEFICDRYKKWQEMLAKNKSGILSYPTIKGLIGELLFLKEKLIPMCGQEIAINSWIGPEKADQDFVCENTWYEVKSTVSGAESIRITSIEQLEMPFDGHLVVVYLDKTSYSNENKITLNSIYKDLYESLPSDSLKRRLSEILLKLGYYPRIEYDEYFFSFIKMDSYFVSNSFPCLRRVHMPSTVINAKYELSIASVTNFLEE